MKVPIYSRVAEGEPYSYSLLWRLSPGNEWEEFTRIDYEDEIQNAVYGYYNGIKNSRGKVIVFKVPKETTKSKK